MLVTAADQPLARRLVTRLLDEGGEVRAYAATEVTALRAAGAIVAVGDTDDEGRLEAALADVHTVIHVGGGLLAHDATSLVETAEVVATAATNAGVRRLICLSLPGADPASSEPLRRAVGQVEARLAAAPPPSIVIRSGLVDTPAVRDALATIGLSESVRATAVAPVRLTDLLEVVVAFDRARSQVEHGHLVVAADGPMRMTLGDYLTTVGVGAPGRGSLVGRRMAAPGRHPLLAGALVDGPWWSDDPVLLDGWDFAGHAPSPPGPAT